MKSIKISLTLLLLFCASLGICQSANVLSVKVLGSSNAVMGETFKRDTAGNIYTCGTFMSTADFDPGPAVYNLTAVGFEDSYVAKYDSTGAFLWVKTFGSSNHDYCTDLSLDAQGNIIVTGITGATTDMNPGTGVYNLNAGAFVTKLDNSGNFIWSRVFSVGHGHVSAMTVNTNNDIYVTGDFYGTADFDPSSSTYNLTAAGSYLPDVYVLKLSSYGDFMWARGFGSLYTDYARAILADTADNIYITGSYKYLTDFDPGAGVHTLQAMGSSNSGDESNESDAYLLKLSGASGNFVWVNTIATVSDDIGEALAFDKWGNIVLTAHGTGSPNFKTDTSSFNISNVIGGEYIWKLKPSGLSIWATSTPVATAPSVTLDDANNVYIAGNTLYYTADFDPSPNFAYVTPQGGLMDCAWVKFDSTGAFQWVRSIGSQYSELLNKVEVLPSGNILTMGQCYFPSSINYDPGPGQYYVPASGSPATFFHVMPATLTIPLAIEDVNFKALLENNNTVALSWNGSITANTDHYIIDRSADAKTWQPLGTVQGLKSVTDKYEYHFTDASPLRGNDFYRLTSVDNNGDKTYSNIETVFIGLDATTINIAPNPIHDRLNITMTENKYEAVAHIYNATGKLMQAFTFTGEQVTADVSALPEGTYYLQLSVKNQRTVRKVVKL